MQLKLPKWALQSGKIRIFAGQELYAVLIHRPNGWYLQRKTERCKAQLGEKCGLCCSNQACKALENGRCNAPYGIPFRCLSSITIGVAGNQCTEKFEDMGVVDV